MQKIAIAIKKTRNFLCFVIRYRIGLSVLEGVYNYNLVFIKKLNRHQPLDQLNMQRNPLWLCTYCLKNNRNEIAARYAIFYVLEIHFFKKR